MMQLWSTNHDAYSHRCRIVIEEKGYGLERGIDVDIRTIDLHNKPEDLIQINPHNEIPVLVDREMSLYESSIICEYLDERFPHPQLMPAGVTEKARARLLIHYFNRELFATMAKLKLAKATKASELRSSLITNLLKVSHSLEKNKYLLGNELTMADVALLPLLWRLEHLEIKLPSRAKSLLKYAETLFARPSFLASLTPVEKQMRK